MTSFINSILASLLATAIAAMLAFFFRRKLGSLVKQWLINIFDMETYKIFSNDTDTEYKNIFGLETKTAEPVTTTATNPMSRKEKRANR